MSNTLELRSTFRPTDSFTNISNTKNQNFLFKLNSKTSTSIILEPVLRKNKNEVASDIVKTIKESLDMEMQSMLEPYVTTKFSTVIKKQFGDTDILSIKDNVSELIGFELSSIKQTCNRFKEKCFIRKSSHKGEVIFDLPGFVPSNELNPPEEATNFKISSKLVALSDFQFDDLKNAYVAISHDIHGSNDSYESPMLPLIKIETQPITAKLYIDRMKANSDNVSTVMIMAIKYFQYKNGKFTHLGKNGCMSVAKIF